MMQLDQLRLDLRPRPNAQALDLGFALLRSHAGHTYLAWLILWLPLVAFCGVLAWLFPGGGGAWLLLAWWLRPLLERAPLYLLSRHVFGETVTWQEALRAWPRQLGGGWFRMLTWWRPFMAGRGLYQPIWQLEGARGKVAAERRAVLGMDNTAGNAYWFGVVCAHFEVILQMGALAFIGVFLSVENSVNPFSYLFGAGADLDSPLVVGATFACYALSGAIIGPIYTACCFTLYLNRRATLEAWDIEIVLRQIKPPTSAKPRGPAATLLAAPAILVLGFALLHPAPAAAGDDSQKILPKAEQCAMPDWVKSRSSTRSPDHDAEQATLRNEVAQLFENEDLRVYLCEQKWVLKNPAKKNRSDKPLPDLAFVADMIRAFLIAAAICLAGWLLYRYRDAFGALVLRRRVVAATEIAGLDIRAESLPADVAAAVRQLWAGGERRAALALLYRATLSRLVEQDSLLLAKGATEGDCLRLANQACRNRRLGPGRLEIAAAATAFWLNGAYGNRWPEHDALNAHCAAWDAEFGAAASAPAGAATGIS